MRLFSLGTLFFIFVSFAASAKAATVPDVSTWNAQAATHPDGTLYTKGSAALGHYPVSSLHKSSGGAFADYDNKSAQDRLEMAVSIFQMDVYETQMTTLNGLPAATGEAMSSEGDVFFAASFSGRKGSKEEVFSLFYAPEAEFKAMGGLEVIKKNPANKQGAVPSGTKQAKPDYGDDLVASLKKDYQSKNTGNSSSDDLLADLRKGWNNSYESNLKKGGTTNAPASSSADDRANDLLAGLRKSWDDDVDKYAKENEVKRKEQEAQNAAAEKARMEKLYRASGARKGYYPAPTGQREENAWPEENKWLVQVKNDVNSPRHRTLIIEGRQALDPNQALDSFAKQTGIKIKGKTGFEKLESFESFSGQDIRILLTETRMAQTDGVAFVTYIRDKDAKQASIAVMEMPRKTYDDWGSVAGMLKMHRLIGSVDEFPKDKLQQIIKSPLKNQMAIYEAVLNEYYMTQRFLLMQSQAQTTSRMIELNYDILLGDDITSPFIAD